MLPNLPRSSHKTQLVVLSCAITFALLLLMLFTVGHPRSWNLPHTLLSSTLDDTNQHTRDPWKFNSLRDGFNHGLSDSQCEEAFPEYYREIDRAALFWKDKKISQAELNITDRNSVARVMIYDRQLYIMESHMSDGPGIFDLSRLMAILGLLSRVIDASQGPIPNVEFVFSVNDVEWNPAPTWTLCRAPENEAHWVMPDFGYWSWDNTFIGSYQQFLNELKDKSIEFSDKKKLAFWRGTDANDERHDLLKATNGQEWADVQPIAWGKDPFVPIVDHCDYQYLIQTEGNSYSGRLKYILNCASVVIMRRPRWIESFTHLLHFDEPNQNVLAVDDFVNIREVMAERLKNHRQSEKISKNAQMTFKDRYLTPAAQACYWRKMFERWASVQDWDPKPWNVEQRRSGDGKNKKVWNEKVWHGLTYEYFMLAAWHKKGQV